MERVAGIEPAWPAWKAGTLPLSYTRAQRCIIPSVLRCVTSKFTVRSAIADSLSIRNPHILDLSRMVEQLIDGLPPA
jgi:hypothetical protein